jgi:hypothetical protein
VTSTPPSSAQKFAVLFAFAASAVSLAVVVLMAVRTGTIQATPLLGGLLMLALGISGYVKLRQPRS